ncbi:MAG: YggS family pyridoxal phosphate-dependent enzyme [Bacteroidales bacterium]|nr:YggS family pyridoxal phosphate-dependent enzyme [Bacteroidales bacterium]
MDEDPIGRIKNITTCLLSSLPAGIALVAAAKTRSPDEVQAVIDSGVRILGYNYVQEAERMYEVIGNSAQWHMIGHLQKNKIKKAVRLFDMIETVDSEELARELDRHCAIVNKKMPVLVEINSGKESNKTGILPEDAEQLILCMSGLPNLQVQGLMTMGPLSGDPEHARPYFRTTKAVFDRISQAEIPNVSMRYLSMGMSNSYKIAVEEGANIIRIGTLLFGERNS